MPNNTAPGFTYPQAALNAPPEVQRAVARFRVMPIRDRAKLPLLYWLLGSSTPEYKESPSDALYQNHPANDQACENCQFMFQHSKSGAYICSQISGNIQPEGWCRLWRE